MLFFPGWHQPSDCAKFPRCCLSINRLWRFIPGLRGKGKPHPAHLKPHKKWGNGGRWVERFSDFPIQEYLFDAGIFTQWQSWGGLLLTPQEYAASILRWNQCGNMLAAVQADWLCSPYVREITGLTVLEHQERTLENYQELGGLLKDSGIYLMPSLQGWKSHEYVEYVQALKPDFGAWVGVGSLQPRNRNPQLIAEILGAIKWERPDLKLHGFGLTLSALSHPHVHSLLYSADSSCASFAARKEGRNANDPQEALRYAATVDSLPLQQHLFFQEGQSIPFSAGGIS